MRILVQSKRLWHLTRASMKCHYYSTKPSGWQEALPLSKCPQMTAWESIKGYMPGGKFQNKDMIEVVQMMHEEKGPVLFVPGFMGKPPLVITQNAEDFEVVLRNEGIWPERIGFELLHHHHNERRKDFFGEKSGLLTTQGKKWADFRSAVNPILMHPKNVKAYLPIMSKVNEEFIDRIKTIRDSQTLEVPETFQDEINRWTLESLAIVALDTKLDLFKKTDTESSQYFKNIHKFFELSMELEAKPSLWRYLPNKKFNECMTILDDMTDFTEKRVSEAMQRIEQAKTSDNSNDSEKSVLEKLLKVDHKLAIIMAMDMLFAGVDTTTTTFSGIMLCLAKNPEKQEKLREEIMHILPDKTSPLTEENMRNLPYLRACLKESLRIYPLSSGIARILPTDIVVSGYQVPSGTCVVLFTSDLCKNSSQFAKPNEFLPERWLRSSENQTDSGCPMQATNPFVYLPFGFGPRSCIGRRIAEMELEIGVARIIRNFQVEFNYSVEKAFRSNLIYTPNIPLKFKFTDLEK